MMSQEVEKHGTSKEDSKSSGSSLESGSLRETRVYHHHHHLHHQSISRLVEDIKKGQDKVEKIRKDQEEARRMQAEQINQQKKLTEKIAFMRNRSRVYEFQAERGEGDVAITVTISYFRIVMKAHF